MRNCDIKFVNKEITSFGGLSLFFKMLEKWHFEEHVMQSGIPLQGSNWKNRSILSQWSSWKKRRISCKFHISQGLIIRKLQIAIKLISFENRSMLLHCAQSGSTKPTKSEYAVTLLNRDSRKILWKFTTYWLLIWYICCNLAKGNKNSSEYRRKVNFGGSEEMSKNNSWQKYEIYLTFCKRLCSQSLIFISNM